MIIHCHSLSLHVAGIQLYALRVLRKVHVHVEGAALCSKLFVSADVVNTDATNLTDSSRYNSAPSCTHKLVQVRCRAH